LRASNDNFFAWAIAAMEDYVSEWISFGSKWGKEVRFTEKPIYGVRPCSNPYDIKYHNSTPVPKSVTVFVGYALEFLA
jgi:hypothetical protein